MVQFQKARPSDAEALAEVSEPKIGGPPGYNSPAWQVKMMRVGEYYKIVLDDQIVGGLIVLCEGTREYELGRIFIAPEFQNQGLGTQACGFLFETYPLARLWTLGTPAWNERTRHFYAKLGFEEVSEDGRGGILLERQGDVTEFDELAGK